MDIDADYSVTWTPSPCEGDFVEAILYFRGRRVGLAVGDNYHDCHREVYYWYPSSFYIAAEHRGKGLGQWLLLALSEAIREVDRGARLVPSDWYSRDQPSYVRGEWGTTEAAHRCWDRLGAPL